MQLPIQSFVLFKIRLIQVKNKEKSQDPGANRQVRQARKYWIRRPSKAGCYLRPSSSFQKSALLPPLISLFFTSCLSLSQPSISTQETTATKPNNNNKPLISANSQSYNILFFTEIEFLKQFYCPVVFPPGNLAERTLGRANALRRCGWVATGPYRTCCQSQRTVVTSPGKTKEHGLS